MKQINPYLLMGLGFYYNNLKTKSASKVCDILQAAALDTWERIRFSRSTPRLKIHETTITQNLVYEMNLLKQVIPGLTYSIYESVDERANGDDLEISIKQTNGIYIKYAVQAKIIYHNLTSNKRIRLNDGRYFQFEHYVGKGGARRNQVDLLLNFARSNGHIPLYLLYNFVNQYQPPSSLCNVTYEIEQYGCSIISAQYLKDQHAISNGNLSKHVRFTHVHPSPALPWFVLACCFPNYNVQRVFRDLKVEGPEYNIREYSSDEIAIDTKWTGLKFRGLQEADTVTKVRDTDDAKPDFNPKFNLVIE